MQIKTLLPGVEIVCKFAYIKRMYVVYFSKNTAGSQRLEHVDVRTEFPIDSNFSVQSRDISNDNVSEKIYMYLDVFVYINGNKVYSWESSFIFHSNNVAVINSNDLRPKFNRSYVNIKWMFIKVPPVA